MNETKIMVKAILAVITLVLVFTTVGYVSCIAIQQEMADRKAK